MKTILILGNASRAREYADLLRAGGARVVASESVENGLSEILAVRPDAVAIILPQYFSSATALVEAVRRHEDINKTPIVYVGGMIEGADMSILQRYGVKTMTLGPVTPSEIVRFILKMV